MRTKIQYYIHRLSGRSRVMRFAYILTRAYKLNLWRLNRNLAETIRVFAKNAENAEIGRLKRSILGCMYQYGISPDEYFLYDFQNIGHKQRDSYVTNYGRLSVYGKLNDYRYHHVFVNKYQTYLYYSPFFKREVVPITRELDNFAEFESLVRRHAKFIYEPLSGSCGRGVRLINTGEYPSIHDLYSSLRAEDGVIEELIIQDERLSRFHPSSVNTVRMPTVITKAGEVVILSPILRVGQRNRIVDNGGAGGILADIDPVTGVVYTNGADEFGNTYVKHPQTGVVFRGFQIPRWDEAVSLAKELASLNPRVRYVGWDLALRADGWVLVEANNHGEFKVLQIADKRGLREELERLM